MFYSDFKTTKQEVLAQRNRYNIPLQKRPSVVKTILLKKILVVSFVMYCGYHYFPIFNPLTMFSHVNVFTLPPVKFLEACNGEFFD